MSLPISDLEFQKSHTKFIIGNEDAIIVSKAYNATDGVYYNITLTAPVNVIDERGGYRGIAPTTISVKNYEILCLSGSDGGVYSDPKIYEKGTGQALYLYKFPFNNPSQTEPLEGYAEIGSVLNFVWNSQYPSFDGRKTRFQKGHAKFIIGNPQGISVIDHGDTVTVKVDGIYLFDEMGGYKVVKSASMTLSNNEILCLSGAEYPAYSDPKIYEKGTGQTLHLHRYLFNSATQLDPLQGYAELGAVMNRSWTPYNPSFAEGVYDRFRDLEGKGLLMKRSDENSPIKDKVSNFVKKWRNRREDVNIVMLDGSISTDMNYSVKRTDEAYRPPCCTERNIPSFIEEKLRWKQQKFRRFDAMTEITAVNDPAFVEVGSGVTKNKDKAWDWIYRVGDDPNGQIEEPPVANYNGLTRILTGANPQVTFLFRNFYRRCDFIYRTDYLCSDALQVIVGELNQPVNGVVEVFDELNNVWKEANGFIFSAQEPDLIEAAEFESTINGTKRKSHGFRKTIFQKRLKMRRTVVDNSRKITIKSMDGGRLGYWGIQYSSTETMINFIDSARGSHNIDALGKFEEWSVDYWKPDLILYSCNTINEGASCFSITSDKSPTMFAAKFEEFITHLLNKPYQPDLMAYILFCMRNQLLVDSNDLVRMTYINGYGAATVFDYHDTLFQTLQELPIASANAFYEFWNIAKARSEYYGTSIYNEMHGAAGPDSNSFTTDATHLNEYGAMVGWRFLEKYFNF
ncbi:hypothetical protein [Dyadobacter sp. 22481]|uniref:hypothetical protein n=1 Tax=Dyadobacter sp. 22481 TaxID=3453926 RepID=UPI003F868273